jgi:hypothetical protein
MKPIQRHIQMLNLASIGILQELEKESPSIEVIKEKMDRRDRSVSELNKFTGLVDASDYSDEDRMLMKSLFDEFAVLNSQIENALSVNLERNRKNLSSAAKTRKAEQSYQVLEEPDISYF